jgi:hypothetical protein
MKDFSEIMTVEINSKGLKSAAKFLGMWKNSKGEGSEAFLMQAAKAYTAYAVSEWQKLDAETGGTYNEAPRITLQSEVTKDGKIHEFSFSDDEWEPVFRFGNFPKQSIN